MYRLQVAAEYVSRKYGKVREKGRWVNESPPHSPMPLKGLIIVGDMGIPIDRGKPLSCVICPPSRVGTRLALRRHRRYGSPHQARKDIQSFL